MQRPGWVEGNSIVIMIESDTGCSAPACEREAESFDGTAAPQLFVTLDDSDVSTILNYPVTQSSDDAEERGAGVPGAAGFQAAHLDCLQAQGKVFEHWSHALASVRHRGKSCQDGTSTLNKNAGKTPTTTGTSAASTEGV